MTGANAKIKRIYVGDKQVRPKTQLIYLPMDSDLSDHSGNNISVTNTGVTLASNVISGRNVAYFVGSNTNNYLIFDLGETPYIATVSFWIKSTKNKSAYFSSYRTSGSYNGFNVQAENTGYYFSCTVFNQNRISSRTLPFDGNWHNIVLAWGGGSYSLYLDKTLLGTQTYSQTEEISKFNFGGSVWDGAGWVYGGYMAEAKMINNKWAQSDVNSNYDSEKSIFGI